MTSSSLKGTAPKLFSQAALRRRPIVGALALSLLVHGLAVNDFTDWRSRERSVFVPWSYLTARLVDDVSSGIAQSKTEERVEPAPPTADLNDLSRAVRHPAVRGVPGKGSSPQPDAATQTPDPTYYTARELDVYPALATRLDLRHGERASAATGRALVLIRISESGSVEDVHLVEADPHGLGEAVKSAFMSARFTPALKSGRAVRSRLLVHIDYPGEELTSSFRRDAR